ncbi:hypothetical protein DAPPUDRAFT_108368 [Daphnia pulex]|uniref:Uncharacterized protein n=1 Tax=Daphnia pulex TaxID=6669 RepID=E9GZZ4_DAPPU|nr:hypothetical protein DAPPUDRAFT_108368 [Daphnia pulex]|eukprot:EFX74976.1 hypothetical protein DAPPUDRAFT_108368 [Daphnia pulex]
MADFSSWGICHLVFGRQRIKQLYKKKSSFSVKKNLRKLPVVGKLKNKIKTDSICGNSDFKAAQEVSTNRKNLATTGSVMMCCVHGCLHKGVMTKGETYSHTLLLLEHIYGLQDPEHANLFIVQDVSCKLDPWLKELARLDPGRFKALLKKSSFFLLANILKPYRLKVIDLEAKEAGESFKTEAENLAIFELLLHLLPNNNTREMVEGVGTSMGEALREAEDMIQP